MVAKHLDGLNSSELRANVVLKINDNPELKSVLLAPFLKDGIPIDVGSTVSYSISVSPPSEGRPIYDFFCSTLGKGAQIVADVVQSEYEKLHKSKKSLQVENVRNVLEVLLEKSLAERKEYLKSNPIIRKNMICLFWMTKKRYCGPEEPVPI